jgi:outer membrane receptor protein involved in Fe transport
MAQSTENEQKNDRRREVNRSPTRRNANLGNATNRVYRLTYLDLVSGPPQERGVHTRADHPGNARSVLGAPGFGFEPGLYSYGKTDTSSQLASYIVALQSSFLGERLVTTLGNRWDNLKEYGSTQRTDPATSEVLSATRNAKPNLDTWESTPSVGAVVHVTPRLSVFGSLSEIFRPQTGQDIFSEVSAPKPAGNITGEGRDLGVRYSLAESKLSVALNYFSTSQDNVRSFWSGSWVVDPINAIWATLGSNRTLFPNIPDVLSQEVQGYEFEAVANPLPGLRVSANAARNDLVTSNRFPNMIQYVADNRSAWLASRSTPMTNTAYGSTVADAVAFVDVIRDRECFCPLPVPGRPGKRALRRTRFQLPRSHGHRTRSERQPPDGFRAVAVERKHGLYVPAWSEDATDASVEHRQPPR